MRRRGASPAERPRGDGSGTGRTDAAGASPLPKGHDRAKGREERPLPARSQSGSFDEAAGTLDRIYAELERRNLTKTADMIRYNVVRAALETDRGNTSAALAYCDSALQYTTVVDRWQVYRQIAEVNLRLRQFEDGLGACDEALAVNPNNPFVLLTLTRIYSAMGDRPMMQEIGDRLLVLWRDADPDFADLGELKKILGLRFPT